MVSLALLCVCGVGGCSGWRIFKPLANNSEHFSSTYYACCSKDLIYLIFITIYKVNTFTISILLTKTLKHRKIKYISWAHSYEPAELRFGKSRVQLS